MEIVHCGGPSYILERLCDYQCWSGVSTYLCAPSELAEALANIPARIVHLHGTALLGSDLEAIVPALRKAREGSAAIIYSGFEIAPALELGADTLSAAQREFFSICDHAFLGSPIFLPLRSLFSSNSWLALGVELEEDPQPLPHAGPKGDLIIVSGDWSCSPQQCEQVRQTITALECGIGPVLFRQIDRAVLDDHEKLCEVLDGAHILVERLDGRGFGLAALEALARGMAVISGNPPDQRSAAPALQFSPILHTTADLLHKRIESLARERRSLRDLSIRALQYVGDYHRLDLAAALMLKKYRELRGE